MKKTCMISTTILLVLLLAIALIPQDSLYRFMVTHNLLNSASAAGIVSQLQGVTGKVGHEDIQWGIGQTSDTYSAPTYSGGHVTLTNVPALAANIASIIKGQWYVSTSSSITNHSDASIAGSLAWVSAVLGTSHATVELAQGVTYVFTSNMTTAPTIFMKVPYGALLSPSTGVTLKISTRPEAGPYQFITGGGTVKFGAGVSPILADWFGNKLDKAYNSATSQSLITYYADQTIDSTIVMSKDRVSIDGGMDRQYMVCPSASFSDGPMITIGVNDDARYFYSWNASLRNVHLNGWVACENADINKQPVVTHNINLVNTNGFLIDKCNIQGALLDNIHIEPTSYDHCSMGLTLRNINLSTAYRHNLYYFNEGCANVSRGLQIYGISTTESKDSAVKVKSVGASTGVDINHMEIQADIGDWIVGGDWRGRHGVEIEGQCHFLWTGGFAETTTDNATLYSFKATEAGELYPPNGIITKVAFSTLPYVDQYSPFYICSSDPHYQVDARNCWRLGKLYDSASWGPPNQPVTRPEVMSTAYKYKYNTGTIWTDGMGVRWLNEHGGNVTDNNTGWRALDLPIKIPFSFSDFSGDPSCCPADTDCGAGRLTLWYPTEGFVLNPRGITLLAAGWSCTAGTTITIGTKNDGSGWITGGNTSIINASFNTPLISSNSSPWRMDSMRGSTPYPDISANGKWNYIEAVINDGHCCVAGEGYLFVDGFYWFQHNSGSTP
jgi:hypothetical protein